ncbi:unnamed protein product [Prunus armeniaca]
MANKAVERYHGDSDYRFLHDRVSELMAECLKHDVQEFNQHQQQRREQEHNQKKKKMKDVGPEHNPVWLIASVSCRPSWINCCMKLWR